MDQDIIQWANQKLASAGKSSKVESFKDHSLADGRVFIDLIDSIVPNSIKYDLVRASDGDEVGVFHSVLHCITIPKFKLSHYHL